MSGHDANPIFFNKKNKDWMSRTLANPPPPTSDNILFSPYPSPPPLKVYVMCITPKANGFPCINLKDRALESIFFPKKLINY